MIFQISRDLQAHFRRSLNDAGRRIVGGSLVGKLMDDNTVHLNRASVTKFGAFIGHTKHSVHTYHIMDEILEEHLLEPTGIRWLGEWFSYPDQSMLIRDADVTAMQEIVDGDEWGSETAVLILITLDQRNVLHLNAWAFRKNKASVETQVILESDPEPEERRRVSRKRWKLRDDNRYFMTSFIHSHKESAEIAALTNPHAWQFASFEDPSQRFFESRDGHSSMESVEPMPVAQRRAMKDSRLRCALALKMGPMSSWRAEIIDDDLENIADLVHAGTLLGYPLLAQNPLPAILGDLDSWTSERLREFQASKFAWYHERVALGCRVAIAAWDDIHLSHALMKYRFSLETDHFTPHSSHPRYGQMFGRPSFSLDYHVKAAAAITIAHSCIEEIGLDIKNERGKNRFAVDNKMLSESIIQDMDKRLRAANMDAAMEFNWIQRGSDPHPMEQGRIEKPGKPSEFQSWARDVRDITLTLPEAIHLVSYLRNKHSTHQFSALTPTVTPHDVHNCQMVARRLLLGKMELWSALTDPQ